MGVGVEASSTGSRSSGLPLFRSPAHPLPRSSLLCGRRVISPVLRYQPAKFALVYVSPMKAEDTDGAYIDQSVVMVSIRGNDFESNLASGGTWEAPR